MRTIIFADIHGCSGPFRTLLGRLQPDPAADRLILLGDLFDRGPDSWGVLQIVRELADAFGDRFVFLRGNHEDYLLQTPLPLSLRFVWERVGRRATVRSFQSHGEKMEDCAPWIREHSLLFYKDSEELREGYFQCVHAGLKIDPMEANDFYTMLHDHEVTLLNRYSGPLTVTGHIALDKPTWFAGDGETTLELPEETSLSLPDHGIICIDAGCGKGGRLEAMVIENGSYRLYGEPE